MLNFLKPGISFGEVAKFYQDQVATAGYEPDGELMHGRGLGEDAPMLWGARKDFPEKDQLLKQGHVFILKPACKQDFIRDSIRRRHGGHRGPWREKIGQARIAVYRCLNNSAITSASLPRLGGRPGWGQAFRIVCGPQFSPEAGEENKRSSRYQSQSVQSK